MLDEDVKERLRHYFGENVEVETVGYRGLKGFGNGSLLSVAEENFDVLVTLDTNLPHQRNLHRYNIGVVVVRPRNQSMEALVDLMPEVNQALREVQQGEAVVVSDPMWED